MMNILDIIEYFKQMGKDEPNLDAETLSARIAKQAVTNKILDEDVFELAEKAYNEGKETL